MSLKFGPALSSDRYADRCKLVEQEQQQEDERILDTIIELGERGLLVDPGHEEADRQAEMG